MPRGKAKVQNLPFGEASLSDEESDDENWRKKKRPVASDDEEDGADGYSSDAIAYKREPRKPLTKKQKEEESKEEERGEKNENEEEESDDENWRKKKRPVAPKKKSKFSVASDDEEEEEPKQPRPQSKVPGVTWHARSSKWIGQINNPLKRMASGKPKTETTSVFATEAACIEATTALRRRIDDEYWAYCTPLAAADPLTESLTRGPEDAADADEKTVYWRPNIQNNHTPFRVVRVSNGKKGVVWAQACQHGIGAEACTTVAKQAVKGGPREFCTIHGGHCPHNRPWTKCNNCNPKATEAASLCSNCGFNLLSPKRLKSKGGIGLCLGCEENLAPPPNPADSADSSKKKKQKTVRVKEYEEKMLFALLLYGYTESFNKGIAPKPGEFTREVYFDYRCVKGTQFTGDEKKYAYVDFVVNPFKGGKLIYLEIDEHMHKGSNYTVLCDTTRMWSVTTSPGFDVSNKQTDDWKLDVNVMWLRVNPDVSFKLGSVTHNPGADARCAAVCELIKDVEGREGDASLSIFYCFYHMDENCNATILADPEYHDQVKSGVYRVKHTIHNDQITLEF